MKLQDFFSEIDKSNKYYFVIDKCTKDSVVVLNEETNEMYDVPKKVISKHTFKNLKRVLDGGNPTPLYQVTRVVGYYSKVSGWNKGKRAELKDRKYMA